MGRGAWLALVVTTVCLTGAAAQQAPVHSWVDRNGVRHLSNAPPPSTTPDAHQWTNPNGTRSYSDRSPAELRRERERRDRLVRCYRGISSTGAMARSLVGKRVVLLSARWCPVSAKARAYLRKRKVRFSEYDIERQRRGRALYARLGTRAVPVILVGRQYMYGFYPSGLARMLRHRHGK